MEEMTGGGSTMHVVPVKTPFLKAYYIVHLNSYLRNY